MNLKCSFNNQVEEAIAKVRMVDKPVGLLGIFIICILGIYEGRPESKDHLVIKEE
jgi:hypothetical protein